MAVAESAAQACLCYSCNSRPRPIFQLIQSIIWVSAAAEPLVSFCSTAEVIC